MAASAPGPASSQTGELTLRFESAPGEYRVRNASGILITSFSAAEILDLRPKGAEGVRAAAIVAGGEQLFSTIFRGEVLAELETARLAARAAQTDVRLWIDLEGAAELEDIPWETLGELQPVAGMDLVRGVNSPVRAREVLAAPLAILAVLTSQTNLRLEVEREWDELQQALRELRDAGAISLARLSAASMTELDLALAKGSVQIVHFVGYGHSDLRSGTGSLILEGEAGNSRKVTGEYIAGRIASHPRVRLAVLEPGEASDEPNPFALIARALVRSGLDAVVALRHRLTAAGTSAWQRQLYTALAGGASIDQSVAAARQTLAQGTRSVEWEAPLLYASSAAIAPMRPRWIAPPIGAKAVAVTRRDLVPNAVAESSDNLDGARLDARPATKTIQERRPSTMGQPARKSSGTDTILVLAADPSDTTRLRVDKELREIDACLRRAKYRDRFHLEHRLAVRPLDLQQALFDIKPQIVHFCGHGAGSSGLVLEDDRGNSQTVKTTALANLFNLVSSFVQCIVLNSCHSETQAVAIAQHIQYVVGMRSAIEDDTAISFAIGFYGALGAGLEVPDAYLAGRSAIELQNLPGHLIPVLLEGRGCDRSAPV